LQVDLTAKYGWRRLHHKMTGGGRIWRRCFKIASETVTCSPKCRDIRRINVAVRRTFVYRPLYITMFTIFTKVADFLMSSVSGATDTSYWQWWLAQKNYGEQRSSPKYQQSFVWSTLPSLLLFFFLLPPFPLFFHASFHFSLHPIPIGADFLKKSLGARFHYPPSPSLLSLPFITTWSGNTNPGKFMNFQMHVGSLSAFWIQNSTF
jgi:hypothetical protein